MKEKSTTENGSETPEVSIRFESVSGDSLQKRFNTLARYYAKTAQPEQWIAEEVKKSLINNIERGTIIVSVNGQNLGLA